MSIDTKATFKGNPQNLLRIWTLEENRFEDYEYDGNSGRTKLIENGTEREYKYYQNKENGNTARVLSDGKWCYTYDANGNRTVKGHNKNPDSKEVAIDETKEYWTYTWDLWNRLVKVEQHNAPDNVQNVLVEYTYDVLNHRIQRESKTRSTVETTQYAYGRNGAITYQKKKVGDSVTTRSFVYLNNQIVGFTDKEGQIEGKFYTVTDIQGSVTEVYDEDGSLVWKSGYTAFGIKAGETTSLLDFDGLYTGCDYDVETGLTYHWNRWRSEDGDSWLSFDPARDGVNWYGYAGCNPLRYQDHTGLFNFTSMLNTADKFLQLYITLNSSSSLGNNTQQNYRSLYHQQYQSEAEEMEINAQIIGLTSSFPLPVQYKIGLALFSLYLENEHFSDIIVLDCRSFIAGAEKELERINAAIECLKDNPENIDLIEFLQEQKEKLSNEINENKNYEKDLSYSDFTGRNVDPPASEPKPGIDYIKAYEESDKNEVQLDY